MLSVLLSSVVLCVMLLYCGLVLVLALGARHPSYTKYIRYVYHYLCTIYALFTCIFTDTLSNIIGCARVYDWRIPCAALACASTHILVRYAIFELFFFYIHADMTLSAHVSARHGVLRRLVHAPVQSGRAVD